MKGAVNRLSVQGGCSVGVVTLGAGSVVGLGVDSSARLLGNDAVLILKRAGRVRGYFRVWFLGRINSVGSFILLVIMLMTFVCNCFLVRGLSGFFGRGRSRGLVSSSGLEVKFRAPTVVSSVTSLLRRFSDRCPGCRLGLFCNSMDRVVGKLRGGGLSFNFVVRGSGSVLGSRCYSLSFRVGRDIVAPNSVSGTMRPVGAVRGPTEIV